MHLNSNESCRVIVSAIKYHTVLKKKTMAVAGSDYVTVRSA